MIWEVEIEHPEVSALLYKYIITDESDSIFLEEASPRLIELEWSRKDDAGHLILVNDTWQVIIHCLHTAYFATI